MKDFPFPLPMRISAVSFSATGSDNQIELVREAHISGWPEKRKIVAADVASKLAQFLLVDEAKIQYGWTFGPFSFWV